MKKLLIAIGFILSLAACSNSDSNTTTTTDSITNSGHQDNVPDTSGMHADTIKGNDTTSVIK